MSSLTLGQRITLLIAIVATAAAGVAHYTEAPSVLAFVVAAVALAALASIVSFATEQVGARFGPAVTGVLQSTLGNLPEFFIVVFALSAGETVVAQTSLVGSLFANALLVLGLVIVVGARQGKGVMTFGTRLPRDTTTLLLLAVFTIVIIGQAVQQDSKAAEHVKEISIAGAIVLLVVYGIWVVSYLRSDTAPEVTHEGGPQVPFAFS